MTSAAAQTCNPWLAQTVRICRVIPETPGVATFHLAFEDRAVADAYTFRPGQFNMLYLPGAGEIAISISGDPGQRGWVPHTIREAGNVTRALAALPEGSSIGLRGPFGSGWPVEECADRNVILVAGGIGLAPLRSAICEMLSQRDRFGKLTLLVGAREPSGLLYPSEYETWRAQGMAVHETVDRTDNDWNGHVGMVTALLDRISLPDPENTRLLTCGPEVMMWYTTQGAIGRGLKPESVFVALERNMNCAIGLCGHCQFGAEFLCRDGPVFRYDRVASILKVHDL